MKTQLLRGETTYLIHLNGTGKKIDPILIRYCYGARIQLICQCIQVQFFDMSVRRQSKQRGMIRCLYVAKVNENP